MSVNKDKSSNLELINTSEVVSIVPFSRSTLLKLIKQGKFPQPFKPSERVHLWHKSDVLSWIDTTFNREPK